jgi:hypothetical protein
VVREVGNVKACAICDKDFTPDVDTDIYCGRRCADDASPLGRLRVLERDGFSCVRCGRVRDRDQLRVCLVVSADEGGTSAASNVYTACRSCANRHDKRDADQLLAVISQRNRAAGIDPGFAFRVGGFRPVDHAKLAAKIARYNEEIDQLVLEIEALQGTGQHNEVVIRRGKVHARLAWIKECEARGQSILPITG